MNDLMKIATSYERSELTMLVLHKKGEGYFNLFTNIELIPIEQEPSNTIGSNERPFERINIDSEHSLFIGRTFFYTPQEAALLFLESNKGYNFRFDEGYERIMVFSGIDFIDEPPGNYPILISNSSNRDLAAVLPKRHTAFRVWVKIDKQKIWLNNFERKLLKKMLSKMDYLTSRHLGFEISELQEHLGNIYLCGCNPLLRAYNLSLLDTKTKLLMSFKERAGKSINGSKALLEEIRGENIGFSLEVIIDSPFQTVNLPYFPDQLVTRLYSKDGILLDKHIGAWVNIAADLNVINTHLNLTVQKDEKTDLIKIPKYGKAEQLLIGSYDHSSAQYFQTATRSRHFLEAERTMDFVFFGGLKGDNEKTQACIREIVERSSQRCILLDPYFGAADIVYAIVVQNTSFPVQIVSSASFLKRRVNNEPNAITNAERLQQAIDEYKRIYGQQNIECRVLKGNKRSPLHDRYIIADDRVYLLGSSFNEFGSRATTLAKVPTPERMIAQALKWWTHETHTCSLQEFVKTVKAGESA